MDAASENFMDRASSVVACRCYIDFKNVTCSSATVERGICLINGDAIDEASYLAELAVDER